MLQRATESEAEELAEVEPPSEPERLLRIQSIVSKSPQRLEDQTCDRDPESAGTPSSAPESDPTVPSSEESSGEEEGGNGGAEAGGEAPGILPSSVLDRAGAIAHHFTNSIRRASLTQEDARSFGCASPRLPGQTRTLRTELAQGVIGMPTEPLETMVTHLTSPSPGEDNFFDVNRDVRRRRDSTLSKQDQLLLSKIKSYYENAGNQSPTFCLQRRESLSYIPAGLVRSSITRINSIPKVDSMETTSSVTTSGPSSSPATEGQGLLDSPKSLDTLRFELRSDSRESPNSQDSLPQEEDFIPSSQMIRIWQTMEQRITLAQKTNNTSTFQEAPPNFREKHFNVSNSIKVQNKDSHQESQDLQQETVFNRETLVLNAPVHPVSQTKPEVGGEQPCEDDMEQTKSKVLHLARQYSQKIRTGKPVVRRRSQGLLHTNSLACVVEELEKVENPGMRWPVPLGCSQTLTLLHLCVADKPKLHLNPSAGQKMASTDQARSSASIRHSSSSSEAFDWPDVQQLRSKYCNRGSGGRRLVSRAHSTPDHVFVRRHSSCSCSVLPEGHPLKVPPFKSGDGWETNTDEWRRRLERASSVDLHLKRMSSGFFVSAKAPLPHDPEHSVIVMEKVLQPAATTEAQEEDGYIQIRSPTSKEKISIMAVIDRCRVYQDSDQYQEGEELKVRPEAPRAPGHEEPQKTKSISSQSVVKHLREKFQNMS